eukprot:629036-Prymnesium_polylepis.1
MDPCRVYGARTADGALIHSEAKHGAPETIPTFTLLSLSEPIGKLRANPVAFSVVEYNGSNHFNPWILKPALRKVANAAPPVNGSAPAPASVSVASVASAFFAAGPESDDGGIAEAVED